MESAGGPQLSDCLAVSVTPSVNTHTQSLPLCWLFLSLLCSATVAAAFSRSLFFLHVFNLSLCHTNIFSAFSNHSYSLNPLLHGLWFFFGGGGHFSSRSGCTNNQTTINLGFSLWLDVIHSYSLLPPCPAVVNIVHSWLEKKYQDGVVSVGTADSPLKPGWWIHSPSLSLPSSSLGSIRGKRPQPIDQVLFAPSDPFGLWLELYTVYISRW